MRVAPALAAMALLLLGGCSEPTGTPAAPAASERKEGAPSGDETTAAPRERKQGGGHGGDAEGAGAEAEGPAGAEGQDQPAPASGGDDGASFATGTSIADDPDDDVHGESAPPYAEIVEATIAGRGDVAVIAIEMAAPIPDRLGEKDNLLAGVGLEYEGEMGGIAVSVQGTRDGWVPGIQKEGEQRELEEGWRIDGNRFVWTVPWSELGGPRRFRWGASLRWFRFTSPDPAEAEHAQDRVPDSAPAVYPAPA